MSMFENGEAATSVPRGAATSINGDGPEPVNIPDAEVIESRPRDFETLGMAYAAFVLSVVALSMSLYVFTTRVKP